jgi:serine/threonine-protein kinase
MAPERITSIDAGPAADLYAVGCILFEMLTGRIPFESQELTGFFIKHMQEPPPRPSELAPQCPRRLEELILKLLEKKPENRPVDAHAVIKELQALAPKTGTAAAPPVATPSRPLAAPTLPPTTLERWARRTAIFEQMAQHAFPGDSAPPDLRALLDGIRNALRRVHELRSEGLKEQRKLEELERDARDTRARLGFAVQSLAEDLSLAREAARHATQEVQPYFDAEEQAKGAHDQALARLESSGGFRVLSEPDESFARTLRDLADAIDRWGLTRGAADKARRWLDAKKGEVDDVELQVRTLRGNLERTENEYLAKRQSSEAVLTKGSGEAQEREQQLIQMATQFCDRLRGETRLRELFARLEQES